MSINDDYRTGNLLDRLYYKSYDKLPGIDLSKQTNTTFLKQIYFIGKLKNMIVQLCFLLLKRIKKYFKLFHTFINYRRVI